MAKRQDYYELPEYGDPPVLRKGRLPKRIQVTPVTMVRLQIGGSEYLLTTEEIETLQDSLRSMYEPVVKDRWNGDER